MINTFLFYKLISILQFFRQRIDSEKFSRLQSRESIPFCRAAHAQSARFLRSGARTGDKARRSSEFAWSLSAGAARLHRKSRGKLINARPLCRKKAEPPFPASAYRDQKTLVILAYISSPPIADSQGPFFPDCAGRAPARFTAAEAGNPISPATLRLARN